jgi:predicted secreted hydrolase
MRRLIITLLLLSILPAGWFIWSLTDRSGEGEIRSQLIAGNQDTSGFARASEPRVFQFPADHGPHPAFLTEWWYFTGNLEAETGEHFGYQLTFFRRGLSPEPVSADRTSSWASNQVYFAHFSITDVAGDTYEAFERFSRGAAGLAGAQGEPRFRAWLEDWEVIQTEAGIYQLSAKQDQLEIELILTETKGPILQGKDGLSPKGPEPGNASYYYSLPALKSRGTITTENRTYEVAGKSWMDHEFSTSALGADQVGWDWFSIQLDDNTELMYFQIRQEDGGRAPVSSGTLIEADGSTQPLSLEEVDLRVTGQWESPHSGAVYPSGWVLTIPRIGLELEIEPYRADQELNVSFIYWEGAVQISGNRAGQAVSGSGYVELTGYLDSFAGRF